MLTRTVLVVAVVGHQKPSNDKTHLMIFIKIRSIFSRQHNAFFKQNNHFHAIWIFYFVISQVIVECNGFSHSLDVPRHVALICDGNSRWAQARGLPSSFGHAAGSDRLLKCLETLKEKGVSYCTFYGFSTENWKRSDGEIQDILSIIERTANKFCERAIKEKVRVKILGDLDDERIPKSLRDSLMSLQSKTYSATYEEINVFTVCLAINYGGRQDILNACVRLASAISEGSTDSKHISEDDFNRYLSTVNIPDPDLVIRTGGDQRLSNFLLWNLAYTELYFTDVLWPDLDPTELSTALKWFSARSRRYGGRQNNVSQIIV
jgi:undecaprenyl diphosphate synthase